MLVRRPLNTGTARAKRAQRARPGRRERSADGTRCSIARLCPPFNPCPAQAPPDPERSTDTWSPAVGVHTPRPFPFLVANATRPSRPPRTHSRPPHPPANCPAPNDRPWSICSDEPVAPFVIPLRTSGAESSIPVRAAADMTPSSYDHRIRAVIRRSPTTLTDHGRNRVRVGGAPMRYVCRRFMAPLGQGRKSCIKCDLMTTRPAATDSMCECDCCCSDAERESRPRDGAGRAHSNETHRPSRASRKSGTVPVQTAKVSTESSRDDCVMSR